MSSDRNWRFTICLTEGDRAKIEKISDDLGITMTGWARMAIRDKLKGEKNND